MIHRSLSCLLLLSFLWFTEYGYAAGPFGFESGMTKDQILKMMGQAAVIQNKSDSLLLKTAPKPHSDFEMYGLVISPVRGLVKVNVVGKTIQTSRYGNGLKTAFLEIRDAVAKTYGEPRTYDLLRTGSIWNEPQDWMMGILHLDYARRLTRHCPADA